ncbi:MAG: hypothetical protein K0S82_44 [Gaiellaceae bacterium]|jgi:hypothetical protein|nr:hypothetical protein [Gaiellaceae bacterium]
MSTTTLQSLTAYADELEAAAASALADTIGGAIDHSGLVAGSPSFECERLSVEVRTLGDAALSSLSPLGAGSRHIGGAVDLIGFRITVVRDCVATIGENGEFPTIAEERADAIRVHEDVWAIWTRIRTLINRGEIFGGRCKKLFFDGARALPIEGGTAGWEIDFRVNIPGFANAS